GRPAGRPGRPTARRSRRRRAGGGNLRRQPRAARRGLGSRTTPRSIFQASPDGERSASGGRMIALVSGSVAVRRSDHVVVDCGGVGYRLAVSAETLRHVPAAGKPVTLHAHLVVRDDALQLYGFATEE